MVMTTPAGAANSFAPMVTTSSLLMAVVEEASDLLLHGLEGALFDLTLWYLDTSASNHMSRCQNYFRNLDESLSGFVKFGDNSKIKIGGRGEIEVSQEIGGILHFHNVLFVPRLGGKYP